MSFKKADKLLLEIIKKRNELSKLEYSDNRYDEVEDELHDLEDDFSENYGEMLEAVITKIHDEQCPDEDVLDPISYIASEYKEVGKDIYDCAVNQGVRVKMDKLPGKKVRLVWLPNPLRLMLNIEPQTQYQVWSSEK
jgi:hypothetical protein